jgi:hypothetical protein
MKATWHRLIFAAVLMAGAMSPVMAQKAWISGYGDVFYVQDFNQPPSQKRLPFVYAYPDNNRLDFNHLLVQGHYTSDTWFGNLGLQAGRYVDENYAAEPDWLKHVYQANIGVNLNSKWNLEMGVFASHIGFESAIGKDNWNLSRSLIADNSPYFETGIKTTIRPNDKWMLSAMVLNGWQNISDTNTNKAVGTQVQYQVSPGILLNSSTFLGNEQPKDSSELMRYFHNFYASIKLSDQWSIATMFDIGAQEKTSGGSMSSWNGGALLSKYQLSSKWAIGSRAEYFSDPDGVIVASSQGAGFNVWGFSVNLDHQLRDDLVIRTEAKWLQSDVEEFTTSSGTKNNNFSLLASISWGFQTLSD